MISQNFHFNQENFHVLIQFLESGDKTSYLGKMKEGSHNDYTRIYVSKGQGVKLYTNNLEIHGEPDEIKDYISEIKIKLNVGLEEVVEDGD